jgi:hypothetical protein
MSSLPLFLRRLLHILFRITLLKKEHALTPASQEHKSPKTSSSVSSPGDGVEGNVCRKDWNTVRYLLKEQGQE